MSHQVCHDIGSWVNQNVQQQVEQCVEQDCNWWCLCCNKWFCFLVWIVVTLVTWVVQTVCEIVADVIDLVVNIVVGLWDIVAGVFTGDWTRVLAGLGEIIGGIVNFVLELIPIVTLGTLVGAFADGANDWNLRDYVRGLLMNKYGSDPKTLAAIMDALGVDSGGFGLRLQGRALRSSIRSDFSSQRDGTPDLIVWIQQFGLMLKALAGFNPPAWWDRNWPELVGDAGDITQVDLDEYIAKNGKGDGVKKFTLFAMSSDDMQKRLDTATQHGTELGLMFRWNKEDARLTDGSEVLIDPAKFTSTLKLAPFSRHDAASGLAAAELCMPMVVAAFGFNDLTINGESAHLADSSCLETQSDGTKSFPAEGITGAAFRYRKPDIAFKYSAIHELGHTFGLCHVDGLLRIMFTSAPAEMKSKWSWSSAFQYWTSGVEAGFILDEAKKAWDYIVANFPADCLKNRPF